MFEKSVVRRWLVKTGDGRGGRVPYGGQTNAGETRVCSAKGPVGTLDQISPHFSGWKHPQILILSGSCLLGSGFFVNRSVAQRRDPLICSFLQVAINCSLCLAVHVLDLCKDFSPPRDYVWSLGIVGLLSSRRNWQPSIHGKAPCVSQSFILTITTHLWSANQMNTPKSNSDSCSSHKGVWWWHETKHHHMAFFDCSTGSACEWRKIVIVELDSKCLERCCGKLTRLLRKSNLALHFLHIGHCNRSESVWSTVFVRLHICRAWERNIHTGTSQNPLGFWQRSKSFQAQQVDQKSRTKHLIDFIPCLHLH